MKYLFSSLLLCSVLLVQAQQLTFDSTFADNGIATSLAGDVAREALDITLQTDGKLVTAGTEIAGNGASSFRTLVSRFQANGQPDSSFAGNGHALLTTGFDNHAHAVRVQADGKILVAGNEIYVTPPAQIISRPFIARLKANGQRDSSFGNNGIHWLGQLNIFARKEVSSLALLSDGRIVAGGTVGDPALKMMLVCLNPDGSYDTGFGVSGVASYVMETGRNAVLWDVLAQSDNKVLLTGYSGEASLNAPPATRIALARVQTNGTLDPAFGAGGVVLTTLSPSASPFDAARVVRQQPDGKICIAGSSDTSLVLARYRSDGTPDPAFGQGGKVAYAGFPAASGLALSGGKLYVSGFVRTGGDSVALSLSGFHANGSPDTSVGLYGQLKAHRFAKNHLRSLLVQPDGRLVAAGSFDDAGNSGILLARFGRPMVVSTGKKMKGNIQVTLYPNPAGDQVTLTISGIRNPEATVTIYSTAGSVVYCGSYQDSPLQIPLHALAAGVYFLRLEAREATETLRFVKE
ncbi:T9SS type A sorting domain-containing protein [Taibaiella helva]|uniref:T9SS type A sorting domain-containing protein n=1 Tax=Taibaiella helva TaxID=2301235 RepID=UPI000E580BB9|nr:T9SS type A sorting domain-containing protein [Taibaiella helva]